MPITFFPRDLGIIQEKYVYNFYRMHKFDDDNFLATTDNGAWVLLNKEELTLLRSYKVHEDPNLFSTLKEKGIILTEDNIKKIVEDYRDRFHFLFRGPTLHIVVPTFRCNMKCIYCHSFSKPLDSKGYDMDEDTAKAIVDFILTSPSKSLTLEFQGGEPLVNFDVLKFIIEYGLEKAKTKNKQLLFSLVTNLTLMDEEKLEFLKRHRVIGISTSFDGPKEVHDKNRRYIKTTGTYDDVVYWIKRIKNEYKEYFSLSALTTITRYSLPFYSEIPQEFHDLGFKRVWLRPLNNLGFAHAVWKKIGYTAEEFLDFYKHGLDYILKLNNGETFMENFATIIAKKILNKFDPMFLDLQSPCGAGIGQLVYDYKGDIFTCDEAKVLGDTFKIGNVKENKLADVINHPTTLSMMNISSKFSLICDACPWSAYCGTCPVNFYVTQGSIVPKLAGEFRCKILGGMIETIFKKIIFLRNEREIIFRWLKYDTRV